MKPFKMLTTQENAALLKFPVYIAMVAAMNDDTLDETEKKSAIKFPHIKTFSCDRLLTEFYKEADKVIEKNIEEIDKILPTDTKSREAAIKKELSELEKLIKKLGKDYTMIMHHSMKTFKDHVSRAHHNVLVDFIFPIPIPDFID